MATGASDPFVVFGGETDAALFLCRGYFLGATIFKGVAVLSWSAMSSRVLRKISFGSEFQFQVLPRM